MAGVQAVATAMQRLETVLQRRPEFGLHDDAPASAHWDGGLRVTTCHANGTRIASDMPTEMGGSGDLISPGWLARAGFAACTTTVIAMIAAARGIEIASLEVRVGSRSDTRGLLGMVDGNGAIVPATPSDLQTVVRIAAPGVPAERLRALVEEGCRRSPIGCAMRQAMPVALHVEVDAA